VFNRPQLSVDNLRVDEAGKIRLPMIESDVEAGCRSEHELSKIVEQLYKEYLVEPRAIVHVREYASQNVNVLGAIQRPGSFQLKRRLRLADLLTYAGGLSATAGDTIRIARDPSRAGCDSGTGDTQEELITVSASALMNAAAGANLYITPGDFVHVMEAGRVYIVGNVPRPTPLPLSEPTTLTRAIALAGGRLPGSKIDVRIIRQSNEGPSKLQVLSFNIRQIERNRVEDPLLKAGDIVDVGHSATKAILRASLEALVATAPIYLLTLIP
jgi:polysaccharide export outer membrane protein